MWLGPSQLSHGLCPSHQISRPWPGDTPDEFSHLHNIRFNDSRNCSIADHMSRSFEEIVYLHPEGLIPLRVQGIVNHPGFRDSCVP